MLLPPLNCSTLIPTPRRWACRKYPKNVTPPSGIHLKKVKHTQPIIYCFMPFLSQAPMPSAIIVGKHHQISCGDNYYKCRLPLASAAGMYYFLLVPR